MALQLTGSINITTGGLTTDLPGRYSGSLSGSFIGDGSGLTGISGGSAVDDFPYTGSAGISGSLEVEGNVTVVSGSIHGDGSGLTEVNPFPFEGQADIIGGLKVDGSNELNYLSSSNGAWSTGAAITSNGAPVGGVRYDATLTGTQVASLLFGGSPSDNTQYTKKYDGTSWSDTGVINNLRSQLGGAGTQNSSLAFGGICTPNPTVGCTEEFNGTSWSTVNPMNIGRRLLGGSGTQNAALAFAGLADAPISINSCTEEYNGTTWSTAGSLNTARYNLAGVGTQHSTLAFGGHPSTCRCTEEYDGNVWTNKPGLAVFRGKIYHGASGLTNSALAFGGSSPATTGNTDIYNGTTWSAGTDMNVARRGLAGTGTQNSALAAGGSTPAVVSCTEEYNADACYRKSFYHQQCQTYVNNLTISGSNSTMNIRTLGSTPNPLTAGAIWVSGSAGAGCLYFSPNGTAICKISFA